MFLFFNLPRVFEEACAVGIGAQVGGWRGTGSAAAVGPVLSVIIRSRASRGEKRGKFRRQPFQALVVRTPWGEALADGLAGLRLLRLQRQAADDAAEHDPGKSPSALARRQCVRCVLACVLDGTARIFCARCGTARPCSADRPSRCGVFLCSASLRVHPLGRGHGRRSRKQGRTARSAASVLSSAWTTTELSLSTRWFQEARRGNHPRRADFK